MGGILKLKNVVEKLVQIKGFSSAKKHCSDEYGSDRVPKDVKEGHFAVIAVDGYHEPTQRFVVPLMFLEHPMFRKLLERAEEEYGFYHDGALMVARVLQVGAVSRTGFVGGTGTSRVRLGNVPNVCEVNPGRQDSSGTGLVRERDVPETFLQKIDKMNSQTEIGGSGSGEKEEPPLWNYVTKLEKLGATGGTWRFKCSFCDEIRQGSYSRVKAHLLALKG
ncbi:hypothetical protein F2Q70_00025621 [Brassica cretica]|uniref:BED-type domain-containing protein n=1 Tax=Brassica cretica TaxID=69181 RepID=A0A8S9LFL6_BRACR|nr:hypothetical protein F2Q70_00025621 [Brassica cretica]